MPCHVHAIPVFTKQRQENYCKLEDSQRLVCIIQLETSESKEGEREKERERGVESHPVTGHSAGKFGVCSVETIRVKKR